MVFRSKSCTIGLLSMQLEHRQKMEVFSQLLELSTDAIVIWSSEQGILYWSQGAQNLYGYSESEALNFTGTRLLKPTYPFSQEDVYKTLSDTGHWEGDIHEVTKAGAKVIVSARFQTITLDGQQVVMAINRDVTRERDQIQQLSTQARLLELCPDAIIVTQLDKEISYWSSGAERLYGYSKKETKGHSLRKLLGSQYPLPYEEMLQALKRDGQWQGDVHEQTKAGEDITVSSIIQTCKQDGKDYYLIVNREVTAHRVMQGELLTLNQDLFKTNRELDEFAYIASHDLKEPVRGIAINADILLRENISEEAAVRLRRMTVLCARVDQLISDLLYFSRLGRGEKIISPIDLKQMIGVVKAELREWLSDKKGVVTIETDLPIVNAEQVKVKAVLHNLILNALKYSDTDRREVKIGFLPDVINDGVQMQNVFYVSDNGIGIDIKNQAKIFHIFRRLNREADYGPGTGAGLAFVKKIIEGYGGKIAVISKPGEGSTFYFTLPLDESEDSLHQYRRSDAA